MAPMTDRGRPGVIDGRAGAESGAGAMSGGQRAAVHADRASPRKEPRMPHVCLPEKRRFGSAGVAAGVVVDVQGARRKPALGL